MGVNICVYRADGTELPDWDSLRYADDKDIAALIPRLPVEERNGLRGDLTNPDFEPHYRPANFSAWREAARSREWSNPDRFDRLIDLLEADPNCWVYFSW